MTIIIIVGFMAEFLYEGHVPIIDELTGSVFTYKDFIGIPTFHVFLVTFAEFAVVYFFYCFIYEKERKQRRQFLLLSLFVCLFLITLYNRAVLLNVIIMCTLMKLSAFKKLKIRYFVIVVLFGIFVLWGFGVFGNIRSGAHWDDSSYIIGVAHIDISKFPAFIPKEFSWAYVYIVSPLGNLNDQVLNVAPTYNLEGFLYFIFPDAVSKRIFPSVDTSFALAQPLLTVCTGFAGVYKYGGFGGMFFLLICLAALVFFVGKLTEKRSELFIVSNSILCCILLLMFFDNMFILSGYTFALVYSCVPVFFKRAASYKPGGGRNNFCAKKLLL